MTMKSMNILFLLGLTLVFQSCNNKKETVTAKPINVERIIFHAEGQGCEGECSTYHLEINQYQQASLWAEVVYGKEPTPRGLQKDTSKMGYFKGLIDNVTYVKLTNIIQNIGIDTLSFDGVTGHDGVLITISIFYNGKNRY